MKIGYDGNAPIETPVRDPEGDGKRKISLQRRTDRLQWLFDHRHIQEHHFDAGRLLQRDFEAMQIGGFATCMEGAGSSHGTSTLADAKLDALARYGRAIQAIPPITRHILQSLVCDNDKSLEKFAAEIRTDRRQIMGIMIAGLDALAVHYGLAISANKW